MHFLAVDNRKYSPISVVFSCHACLVQISWFLGHRQPVNQYPLKRKLENLLGFIKAYDTLSLIRWHCLGLGRSPLNNRFDVLKPMLESIHEGILSNVNGNTKRREINYRSLALCILLKKTPQIAYFQDRANGEIRNENRVNYEYTQDQLGLIPYVYSYRYFKPNRGSILGYHDTSNHLAMLHQKIKQSRCNHWKSAAFSLLLNECLYFTSRYAMSVVLPANIDYSSIVRQTQGSISEHTIQAIIEIQKKPSVDAHILRDLRKEVLCSYGVYATVFFTLFISFLGLLWSNLQSPVCNQSNETSSHTDLGSSVRLNASHDDYSSVELLSSMRNVYEEKSLSCFTDVLGVGLPYIVVMNAVLFVHLSSMNRSISLCNSCKGRPSTILSITELILVSVYFVAFLGVFSTASPNMPYSNEYRSLILTNLFTLDGIKSGILLFSVTFACTFFVWLHMKHSQSGYDDPEPLADWKNRIIARCLCWSQVRLHRYLNGASRDVPRIDEIMRMFHKPCHDENTNPLTSNSLTDPLLGSINSV